ncbi:hypothetical protein [Polymorphum gilvum]|uniref:Uncharacterized protein n=1 Tax=Polymorphum gilvum (strain LMG 25793 / CGMCC 1.9160 / SL003B-26A1) TaxID=991905 RepID=F2J2F6_POLGS|nr:hypothetical protein [Polymorphum gilvum]ADZ69852.1 hypothetical protein SL003B_1424 [Polymorphum gilvum SL003B-26A1]
MWMSSLFRRKAPAEAAETVHPASGVRGGPMEGSERGPGGAEPRSRPGVEQAARGETRMTARPGAAPGAMAGGGGPGSRVGPGVNPGAAAQPAGPLGASLGNGSRSGLQDAGAGRLSNPAAAAQPSTSALNQKVVQAVQFTNTETESYGLKMATTPPEIMVGQTTGLAVQDAANYMNAVMQIALAAQAVAIKKAAEGPIGEIVAVPLLGEIQNMVNAAVTVYGTVSSTAGQSAKTILSDLNVS